MDRGSHPIAEGLWIQAIELAQGHVVTSDKPQYPPVLAHLAQVTSWLDDVIMMCRHPGAQTQSAARWILDNDYQIRRTVRQITEDMPPGFYDYLPSLESDEHHDLPRALVLVRSMLDNSNLQPSLSRFVEFVDGYQTVQPLV